MIEDKIYCICDTDPGNCQVCLVLEVPLQVEGPKLEMEFDTKQEFIDIIKEDGSLIQFDITSMMKCFKKKDVVVNEITLESAQIKQKKSIELF